MCLRVWRACVLEVSGCARVCVWKYVYANIQCSFERGCRAWLTDDQTAKNLRSILIAASTGDDIDEEANEKDKDNGDGDSASAGDETHRENLPTMPGIIIIEGRCLITILLSFKGNFPLLKFEDFF